MTDLGHLLRTESRADLSLAGTDFTNGLRAYIFSDSSNTFTTFRIAVSGT